MDPVTQWSLDLIAAVQQIDPVLDVFFGAVTFLGEPEFHLLLLPLLFWCVDLRLGARVGVFLLLSSYLNLGLKALVHQPRPFDLDPGLQLTSAEGYGLPSGHAQLAVVAWGAMAAWTRKGWFWGVAISLMALIGLSRIYLGVHFPADVLAGWAVGGLSLAVYLAVLPGVERWLAGLELRWQLLLALGMPAFLFLIHPAKNTATAMGTLAGAGLGLVLAYRYVHFSAHGSLWQRVLRFLIGGVVVVLLYGGLKVVFPGEGSSLYLVFRFLGFGIIGLWATLGAPWLFRRLRLAPDSRKPAI